MKCPFCQATDNRVIDSRLAGDGQAIRRRRECEGCERRFTTYERVEEIVMPMVVKRDGSRVVFTRTKVVTGIRRACQKRPVPAATIEEIVDEIERELQESGESEFSSTYIGERVMEKLRAVDLVAYVRFASVYRAFDTVQAFLDELNHLLRDLEGRN